MLYCMNVGFFKGIEMKQIYFNLIVRFFKKIKIILLFQSWYYEIC